MKKQLSHISIFQTCKVFAIIYFVLTAVFCVPWALYVLYAGDVAESIFLLFMPFIYAFLSCVFLAIFIWLYNIVAASFGGIEFTCTDVEEKE